MKRHRNTPFALGTKVRGESGFGRRNAAGIKGGGSGPLAAMPAPLPLPAIDSDKVVQDVLLATLFRLRQNSSRAVALSCERWIERILTTDQTGR